jgi:hypothetical protein
MEDKIALYAKAPRLREAIPTWTVAVLCTAVGIAGIYFGATGEFASPTDSWSVRAFPSIFLLVSLPVGLWMLWELIKASGRVVPLAWILVDGHDVRLQTPILRGATTRGMFVAGEPIAAFFTTFSTGSAWPALGAVRHSFSLVQGDARARCSGFMQVSEESFAHARQMLALHGISVTLLNANDVFAEARPTDPLPSVELRPAPSAPAKATVPFSSGELTLVPLGSDEEHSVGGWPPLRSEDITDHFVVIPMPGASSAAVTATYETPKAGVVSAHHDFEAWSDHLVFVDEVAGDPCHIILTVPVRGVDVYPAPGGGGAVTLHLLAADASAAE